MTESPQRVCFVMYLKPDRVEDYLTAHEVVWPDMLDALRTAGWHNYTLFLRPDDGMVVGYLETDDFDAARERMAATDVNARWQAGMAQYFLTPQRAETGASGATGRDPAMQPLDEYFHLA